MVVVVCSSVYLAPFMDLRDSSLTNPVVCVYPKMGSSSSIVHVLYDNEILARRDLDSMEDAIRNVRATSSSSSNGACSGGTRRCNILETSAYMQMRLTLLRWVSSYHDEDEKEEDRTAQSCMCHIGNGISLHATWPVGASSVVRVRIVWKHSDNDGSLPVVDSQKKKKHESDDDDDFSMSSTSKKKKR